MGRKTTVDYAEYSLMAYDYASQIGQFDNPKDALIKAHEIGMLENAGVKYNKEDVIFAVKTKEGRLYWLEKGNDKAGLNHIIGRHGSQFMEAYGVSKQDIPGFIKNMVTSGNLISERTKIKNGRITLEQYYKYKGKLYTLNAVGTNGFIVSVYPAGL